jgi:hypothetical protein
MAGNAICKRKIVNNVKAMEYNPLGPCLGVALRQEVLDSVVNNCKLKRRRHTGSTMVPRSLRLSLSFSFIMKKVRV